MLVLIPPTADIWCFNTASGMDCMQFVMENNSLNFLAFQYRKRYGLHAIAKDKDMILANAKFQYRKRYGLHAIGAGLGDGNNFIWFQYRKRYGLHAILIWISLGSDTTGFNTASGMDCMQCLFAVCTVKPDARHQSFNTASGMDCMQYRPSQPLGQLNPEAGFLNGAPFLANRRDLAGFFCRQNRLKTSANPVISRKLLSTGKT